MATASIDGYIEDEAGGFDFAAPDDDVHEFVNDLVRPASTHLYGRRMYETMTAWETEPSLAEQSPVTRDFAGIWQNAEKIVYSRTLAAPITGKTAIERQFDAGAVRALKARGNTDMFVGGPGLAGHALRAALVDECLLFVVPVSVGGGKPAFPVGVRLDLDLLEERRFANGTVFLRYTVRHGVT